MLNDMLNDEPYKVKAISHAILISFVWIFCCTLAWADGLAEAWWYGFVLPTEQLNSDARFKLEDNCERSKILDMKDIRSVISNDEFKSFKNSTFSFENFFDLNHNGKKEHIVVGVCQRKDGSKGQFLAIFEHKKLMKVFTRDGESDFSALLIQDKKIRWYFCMECEDFETVVWTGNTYSLE